MDEACARIFCSDGTLGLVSDAVCDDLRHGELTSYPDGYDGDDWDFADVHGVSHAYVSVNLRQHMDAI